MVFFGSPWPHIVSTLNCHFPGRQGTSEADPGPGEGACLQGLLWGFSSGHSHLCTGVVQHPVLDPGGQWAALLSVLVDSAHTVSWTTLRWSKFKAREQVNTCFDTWQKLFREAGKGGRGRSKGALLAAEPRS